MADHEYDLVILGAGPGGYVAAIRAAQLGFKTAVVDDFQRADGQYALGGTCLNVGCIPSKALLDTSHHYAFMQHDAHDHGIDVATPRIDVARMIGRKDKIVAQLTGGIAALFAKHKIAWHKGRGRFTGPNSIAVVDRSGSSAPTELQAKHIIIATGSRPRAVPDLPIDNQLIIDSTGALALDNVPKELVIVGGGVIALELGSVWRRLGSHVTLLVRGKQFLPRVEPQLAREAWTQLTAQGLDIRLGAAVTHLKRGKKTATLSVREDDKSYDLAADKILVCVGRVPNSADLGLEHAGIATDKDGFIDVNEHCSTRVGHIFAIGDVVRGPMLAHKASEEGIAVVERLAGHTTHVDFNTVPWVIYTDPEIAWVGATSDELTAQGRAFRSGVFPFKASGRAHAMGHTHGFVKILADAHTDRVLGVHIVGPQASEMIAEAVLAMEWHGSAEDIARTIHAHPTLSEAFHEAALAVDKRSLHI